MKASVLIALLALTAWPETTAYAFGTPVGTAFTYQGQLRQAGELVDGTADIEFRIFDVPTFGTPLAPVILMNNLLVEEGQFTVELDFGAGIFGTDARWLEIVVRSPAGSGQFFTLTPRQQIRPAPVAQFALNVDGASVTNLNASSITSGVIGNAQTSGSSASAANSLVLRDASGNFAANTITANGFSGSGAALTSLNASSVASGNLSTARLPTGGAWSLTSNLNLDSNTLVVDQANNRVGIGTAAPSAALHVAGLARFTGPGGFSIGSDGSQTRIDTAGAGEQLFRFLNPASQYAGVRLREASIGGNFGDSEAPEGGLLVQGKVGVGTTTPVQALDVVGTGGPAASSGSSANGLIRVKPDNSSAVLDIGATGGGAHGWLQSRDAGNYATNYNLALNPNGGNVGVGTASPATRFHVQSGATGTPFLSDSLAIFESNSTDGTQVSIIAPNTENASLYFGSPQDSTAAGFIHTTSGNLNILAGGSTQMAIGSTGNVGIGTGNPQAKLHVNGPADTTSVVLPNNAISKTEIADEPGLASFRRSDGVDLPIGDTPSQYGLRTITCPADGYVLAIVTAWLTTDDNIDVVDVAIGASLSPTSLSSSTWANRVSLLGLSQEQGWVVTVQSVFPVSAGSTTIYIVAEREPNHTARMRDPRMTLIYLPSAYGTVISD